MQNNTVFIGLGGNIGDSKNFIDRAKNMMSSKGCKVLRQSAIYETTPLGFTASQNFYNQAIKVETQLCMVELINVLQEIEKNLGRTREGEGYQSRTMDIDILLFNSSVIELKNLTIPHSRMHLRKFVLVPLNEIAPDLIHPKLNKTIQELLIDCPDESDCVVVNV